MSVPIGISSLFVSVAYTAACLVTAIPSGKNLLSEAEKIITVCCNNLTNPLTPECAETLSKIGYITDPDMMHGICVRQIQIITRSVTSWNGAPFALGIMAAIALTPAVVIGIHRLYSHYKKPQLAIGTS